ncbi:3-oxoacyl-ACP synthase [Parapedobacter sp. GCM10030251]|uniref:3-oxoacyl-ACP synthase n=1 Tax=Parapedobacter sp. GCM10030251 TaxID=3273419 RepID=UPI00361C34E1
MNQPYHAIKTSLLAACRHYVDERIANALQALASASDAAADDTKSSAGDKFEATREMMQQEIARHQQLLADAERMAQVLASLDARPHSGPAKLGSLIETDRGTFFLAVSAGRLDMEGNAYWAVSTASPIGSRLVGLQAGDRFSFNQVTYVITQVS